MNRFLLPLAFLCSTFIVHSQVTLTASDCEYDQAFEYNYLRDANRLAVRYLYEQRLADTVDVRIDPYYYEKMLRAIAVARNETSERWQFDVFEKYDLHTRDQPSLDHLYLTINRDVSWVSNWIEQETLSGHPEVDRLMEQYSLKVEEVELADGNLARVQLQTTELLNIRALVLRFKQVEGIIEGGDVATFRGNYSDITYSVNEQEDAILTFHYEWGNCEKSCLYQYEWTCTIDEENCGVLDQEQGGDPLSVRFFDFFLSLDVFPNPTTNQVNLHVVGPPYQQVEVSLFNAAGKKMSSEAMNTLAGQLDVEVSLIGLPVGIYYVSFSNGEAVHTEKIIKL